VLVVALLVVSSRADAGPAEADKLAAQADALVKEGKLREAAKVFAQAAKEDPTRPAFFCNIGIVYYQADDLARAHLVLGRCLLEQSALEADFVANAKAALESVETSLRAAGHTPVEVTVTPPGASVRIVEFELDEAFVGRRVVWLPFGTFHLTARAEGYREKSVEVVTSTKDPKSVKIDLERDTGVRPIDAKQPRPPVAAREPSKLPAILATAGTVGSFVVAGIAFSQARSAADLAGRALDNPTHAQDKSSVDRWNATFAITTSLGVAGAVVSGYLWYRSTKTPAIEVAPTAGGAAVSLRGRF
jgi:tetratricopeptide (TPR) repeat protein